MINDGRDCTRTVRKRWDRHISKYMSVCLDPYTETSSPVYIKSHWQRYRRRFEIFETVSAAQDLASVQRGENRVSIHYIGSGRFIKDLENLRRPMQK